MIKDSGNRKAFTSGAVRDRSEGKGRCDLLPLGILGKHMKDFVLTNIHYYLYRNEVLNLWNALKQFIGAETKDWCSALIEVSKHYEEGAKKYAARNWEKGIPIHCYIDSGIRHYLKHLRGDTDEPHDRAFIWNMLGAIWTHINLPEMNDNPGNTGSAE